MARLVLWSGGMDSTCLVNELALAHPTEMINAITITEQSQETHDYFKAERQARKVLKPLLPKNVQFFEVTVYNPMRSDLWTLPLWICNILLGVNDKDSLHIAYLSTDGFDFFHGRAKVEKIFNEVMSLRGIDASLEFDYENITKGYVIQELKRFKLLRFTSYCGQPKKNLKPCGKCMKCLSVKRWTKYPDKGIET